MNLSKEIDIAKAAMHNAYAPYTKYFVGCALKASSGKIYSGCNIQNHGIQSICAERVAFCKAISEGEKSFEYMLICGSSDLITLDHCLPCGYCRQFISEFVNENFTIYVLSQANTVSKYFIKDLLPHAFKL